MNNENICTVCSNKRISSLIVEMILALRCRCGRPKDEKKMLLKITDYITTAKITTAVTSTGITTTSINFMTSIKEKF